MRRRVPSPFRGLSTNKWNTVTKAELGVKPSDSMAMRTSTTMTWFPEFFSDQYVVGVSSRCFFLLLLCH